MRKIIVFIFFLMFAFSVSAQVKNFSVEENTEFKYGSTDTKASDNTNIGEVVKKEVVQEDASILSQIQEAFGVNYSTKGEGAAIYYASLIINYFLGIVSFVALVVMIYGFYFMFFWANNEETFGKAKKYVGLAALSLILMGISWFIVSWFFHVVTLGV